MALVFTGGEWIPSSLATEVCAIVESAAENAFPGAVVLASMTGDRSAGLRAMRSAESKFSSLRQQSGLPALFLRLAIAKAESRETTWIRPDLVRSLGAEASFWDHSAMSSYLLIGAGLMGRDQSGPLGLLLDSDDAQVALGALRLSWSLGLVAGDSESKLLRLAERGPGDVRLAAAYAMGAVVSDRCLPELERLASLERDETLRGAYLFSVKLLRLGH